MPETRDQSNMSFRIIIGLGGGKGLIPEADTAGTEISRPWKVAVWQCPLDRPQYIPAAISVLV